MRHCDVHDGAISCDAVDLLERSNDVVQVLDDVVGVDLIEGVIAKRPRHPVEIVDDVGAHPVADVEIDGAGERPGATSEVESLRDDHYGVAWPAGRLASWRRNASTGCILGLSIVPSGGLLATGTTTSMR